MDDLARNLAEAVTDLSLTGLQVFRDLMQEAADDPKMGALTLTLTDVVRLCNTCLVSVEK